jgi:PAS domain S-box-containing protein
MNANPIDSPPARQPAGSTTRAEAGLGAKAAPRPLQVLIVEDSENDALLLEIELQRAGYDPVCHRVDTAAAMKTALQRQRWDLIIADYVMPRFNGLAALALVKAQGLEAPFIVVSGHISDDTAVAAMKAGAHDYVMKDNLARLGPAVRRELHEAGVRRARRLSEERLKEEHIFREAIENSIPAGVVVVDLEGRQSHVNPAFCAMVGWTEGELVGAMPPFVYWPPEEVETITTALGEVSQGRAPAGGVELRFRRRDDEGIEVLLQATPLKDSFGNITGWVSAVSDITQRKRAEVRLAAEHAVTRILANAPSLPEAAPGIVQVLLESLAMDVGALWLPDARQAMLCPSVIKLRAPSPALEVFLDGRRRSGLVAGTGLPGAVWLEHRVIWVTNLSAQTRFEGAAAAAGAGLRSAVAFPIESSGRFFGVLEFLSARRLEYDPLLVNMMTAIGSEIGQFVQRRSAEDALRRAHDQLEMRVRQRTAQLESAHSKLQTAIGERKRLEHELLEITENERRRIGLDLHDDLGQRLSGIALMTKGLELRLAKQQAVEAQEAAQIHELVQQTMNHARNLARDLTTLDLKRNDLPDALDALAVHATGLFKISCRFKAEGLIPQLESNVVNQLYKITQEAVTNAIKHGKAKRVGISLANGADRLLLTVQNNGLPFPDLQGRFPGMGLRIMNYRANLIGASLEIKAAGAHGTRLTCSMPLDNHHFK